MLGFVFVRLSLQGSGKAVYSDHKGLLSVFSRHLVEQPVNRSMGRKEVLFQTFPTLLRSKRLVHRDLSAVCGGRDALFLILKAIKIDHQSGMRGEKGICA